TGPVLLLEVKDRPPRIRAPAPVDLVHQRVDIVVEILVLTDMGTAGHADLDKLQSLPKLRILLEQPVQSPQPLQDALGVIDAVDADGQELIIRVELLPPAL